jgi:hypothetical protein
MKLSLPGVRFGGTSSKPLKRYARLQILGWAVVLLVVLLLLLLRWGLDQRDCGRGRDRALAG